MAQVLRSYLCGEWRSGTGTGLPLVNPTTEEVLATSSTEGLDLAAALQYGRTIGGKALRELSFEQRGDCLAAASKAIHAHREELIELAIANGGNTRGDAKFDIDGGTGTMMYYASLGRRLGDKKLLVDGELKPLARAPRFVGTHVSVPLSGVAIHLNAFNFPAWGMLEKAAVALLAGVPVLSKPATPTALVSHRIMEILVESEALPEGSLQMLAGEPCDLLDHVRLGDCVAFTGSSRTGNYVRSLPHLQEKSVRVNVEADSLNAAVLGPDVDQDSPTFDMFCREVVREMTQKAGQKCTAIRRIFVPEGLVDAVTEELKDHLSDIRVGNPASRGVRVGPLTSAAQYKSVTEGIERLRSSCDIVFENSSRSDLIDIEHDHGYFVGPTLFRAHQADDAEVHAEEVFGPVATILPYSGSPGEAACVIAKGEGGLVASVFSDDVSFCAEMLHLSAAWNGRLYFGSERIAEHATGHGAVLPQLQHGGPGRAGGGSELGGLRGLAFYMQKTAIQGAKPMLEKLLS
jgi:oxepin-CoA hydrolase/3-oxo-5,6-dehydrosuberyl-CoA semialdehyde dehydrogenase